ncbi:hypothetical protein DFJ63DRAFT_315569 [Scheffersomyces coipomensis]|uniref:uncharacterized protein n=1 Tax=Scheffersomyces coipomensis TaxID=1788519 RepID=UPI00315C6F0B
MYSSYSYSTSPSNGMPVTSFPTSSTTTDLHLSPVSSSCPQKPDIDDEIDTILINSDSQACNENLSTFIKCIIDKVYLSQDESDDESIISDGNGTSTHQKNYHKLSMYALKLVNSNLFIKNYRFCIGKLLAFLSTFTSWTEYNVISNDSEEVDDRVKQESECLKEFLCIILLVLLKLKNSANSNESNINIDQDSQINLIETEDLFNAFKEYDFITIISNFISVHVTALDQQKTTFVLFKFSCDIFFEYLYYTELLTDDEFSCLTTDTQVIPTLIKYLLSNENFSNYDIDGDDFEDEDKLIAYEEFKLLLLINEQYLMKSYSNSNIQNKVFNGLMKGDSEDVSPNTNHANIAGFINLLIYYLNREESQIIKILILKFLYLVFTTSYTTRLVYLNDLKILIDIFIRELNNMDFRGKSGNENRFLAITYLKVMYPLLMFSQVSDLHEGYKNNDIYELFENLILNCRDNEMIEDSVRCEQEEVIRKLSKKCMSINWLKLSRKRSSPSSSSPASHNSTSSSLTSLNNSNNNTTNNNNNKGTDEVSNASTDSIVAMARVASVRTSSRSDYHKHTTSHNIQDYRKNSQDQSHKSTNDGPSLYRTNNNNVFLDKQFDKLKLNDNNNVSQYSPWLEKQLNEGNNKPIDEVDDNEQVQQQEEEEQIPCNNILDLPVEYLKSKKLPKVPIPVKAVNRELYKHKSNSSSSVNSLNSAGGQRYKKSPPPPPPPPSPYYNGSYPIDIVSRSSPITSKHGTPPPPPPPPPRRRR